MLKLISSIIFVLFSCSLYAASNDAYVDKLVWTGCGITKKAFMAEIAAAYKQKYGVTIDLQGGGATKGIRDTKAGKSHLGGTCRIPLQNVEEGSMLLKMVLVAWDALVVIVNKDTPISSISKEELKDVLNGDINYWQELSDWQGSKDGKDKINLFARESKISGVGYTSRKMLFDDIDKEFNASKLFPSSGPLEKAIVQENYSMGMTGISSARKRDIKVLRLDGVKPDYDTIKNGDYTMYRPLYLTYTKIYKLPENEKKEVRRFLEFIKSEEAANIIRANGVVPFKDGFHLMKQRKDIFGS